MAASSQWIWVNCSFKLHTIYHVLGHFGFHWWCPYIQSSEQCNIYKYIYTYISLHLLVKGNTRISLKQSIFYEVELWTSLVWLQPTICRLHTEFYYSSYLRSSNKASQIYFYISGSPNKEFVYEKDKQCELNMSDDGHFEFYDLWDNVAIYSLAYGRNGFSTTFSCRNNKWSTFPQKYLQVFI